MNVPRSRRDQVGLKRGKNDNTPDGEFILEKMETYVTETSLGSENRSSEYRYI